MSNTKLIAGALALSLTAVAMVTLAPVEASRAAVLASEATERSVVIHKTEHGPSTAEIVEAACQFGGCQDI